ncbi:MAG: LysR family transcriptional regulator [Nocardiopsaceae bacterium]|jgi:DNA-binding transcriptional LysR family regulator|nr:LysR family transcriptional regulator [Nocardiopsaceae bacterium]
MELRQLQYLVSVSDEASFTKAAALARVAQPGVSAQIRRLEAELGQQLLDRSGPAVQVTEAGAAVLPYARAALAAVAAVRETADALAGLSRGQVTVGIVGAISSPSLDLPGLLAGFHHDHPGIGIRLTEASTGDLTAALRAGRLDVALISAGPELPPDLAPEVVVDEPLVIAVSPADPLARRRSVSLAALAGRELISLPPGTGLRGYLDDACAGLGFQPRIAFEVGDPRIAAQLAGRGLGAALLPESVIRAHRGQVRGIPLARPRLRGRIALACRPGPAASPAARAFIAHARQQLTGRRSGPGG